MKYVFIATAILGLPTLGSAFVLIVYNLALDRPTAFAVLATYYAIVAAILFKLSRHD